MSRNAEATATIATVIADFTTQRDAMQRRLDGLMNTLISHNWVVECGSMYVDCEVENKVVTKVWMTGVQSATMFTKADAYALCAGDNIRNGLGQVARPVGIRDALRTCIANLDNSIAHLREAYGE